VSVLVVLPPLPVGAGPLWVALAPESLTEMVVPLELFRPWTTTTSPPRTDALETLSLLAILVAQERVTLTVFPVVSVR
jgi:hypothetical protein